MKIHVDMISNEFGDPSVKQVIWGEYGDKPVSQIYWDDLVTAAAQQIAETEEIESQDVRPRVKDLNSGQFLLVDTGAQISVWPKSLCPEAKLDESKGLQAVNGSKMPTYGTKTVKIRLNKRVFQHEFVISNVQKPILGWNFILKFQ